MTHILTAFTPLADKKQLNLTTSLGLKHQNLIELILCYCLGALNVL